MAVAALGLARERELGTLEQLMVTPLRRFELTVGKGIPAIAIGKTSARKSNSYIIRERRIS